MRTSRVGGRRTPLARFLRIEPLEERRLLDASTPWQNPVLRLDVDNSGVTTSSDLLLIINRLLEHGAGELPVPPTEPVERFYDTTGDNRVNASDVLSTINGILQPPEVQLSMFARFSADFTPEVTVTALAQGSAALPNGALVEIDLDLNFDGDFNDPGERSQTQSTLWEGRAVFNLNSGYESQIADPGFYPLKLQARVRDSEGVKGTSNTWDLILTPGASDALENYVNAPDASYSWEWLGTAVNGADVTPYTYYVLRMTSQTWRSMADVNDPQWDHWLEVYVPKTAGGAVAPLNPTGLLFIRGGNNMSNPPNSPSSEFAQLATANQAVVARLHVVPNQSVVFNGETQSREEDEIIAYTFDKFLTTIGQPGYETWPALLPMVKSAVRAMDTVQTWVNQLDPNQQVENFFVSGESKRGWTTWLTAAVDDRVRGIMPGVFDNLNQAPQMVNHYAVLGQFSEQVHDYTDLQIFERILTPQAIELGRIVDPYSYLRNGRFDDMPKLILNSAGDEFFTPDSARFYFQDLPGDQNYLRYIPNTGHGLDSRAVTSRATFFYAILHDRPLPKFDWHVAQDGSIHVQTQTMPEKVLLWQKHNPDARDFRNGYTPQYVWTSTELFDQGDGTYVGNVDVPSTGAIAYFIELTFPNSVLGAEPYVFTTEARVKSLIPLAEWPYANPGLGLPLAAPTQAIPLDPTRAATASALAVEQHEPAKEEMAPPPVAQPFVATPEANLLRATEQLLEAETLDWLNLAVDGTVDDELEPLAVTLLS